MKRSEAVAALNEILATNSGGETILALIEKLGMLPPAYVKVDGAIKVDDINLENKTITYGTTVGTVNEWEPEG